MGTNFYLRRVKPREVHDLMHIAKRSAGWVIHFQDSTEGYAEPHDDAPEPPAFHSVADIRDLLESGDWQLADEYGDVWEPGDESLREFDKLCRWRGGPQLEDRHIGDYPHGDPPYDSVLGASDYTDPNGYRFTSIYFR